MNKINFHEVFALLSEHEIIYVLVCSVSDMLHKILSLRVSVQKELFRKWQLIILQVNV